MGQLLIRSAKSSQKNASPDTEDGYQYLFKAVQSGNVHQLKRFVDLKPGLKIEDIRKEGKSLLHTAVIHHQLDCMRYILELGLDANVQDSFGRSALIELIENKAKDRVCLASHNPRCLEIQLILLLKFKADINALSTVGRTALLKSIIYRHPLTELLLQHGADPNLADKDGLLPIHVCATYSCLQLLKQILKCGADINGQDSKGRTALYFSVLAGHQDIFNELISHQCDINKGSKYGFPLQTAVVKGRLEMVQALLENGADVQSKVCEFRQPYSRTSDYLYLALIAAHTKTTIPAMSTAKDIDKAKRSLQILYLIIQAVSYSENLGRNAFVKTRRQPFEEENLLALNKMIALLLRKLAFVYKMGKNSKPVDGLPKLDSDIDTNSLQNICRMRVRQLMSNSKTNIIFAVKNLDCPTFLKDLILLKDIC